MMHKIIVIISLLASCMFIGCQDGETYASQLKKEQKLIADFISRNNIKVVKTMPTADEWKDEKLYYLSSSGLYFHLVDAGDTTGDSIQQNDFVFPRYIKYTLKANADTLWVWNTVDATYPGQFKYLDLSQACEAWH
ncbi:MAG: DUF4827 domain-containing protein, partial [Paludibacter sp.]|nr:DUF4827 domain-containing protein [Paludibacter sp.]